MCLVSSEASPFQVFNHARDDDIQLPAELLRQLVTLRESQIRHWELIYDRLRLTRQVWIEANMSQELLLAKSMASPRWTPDERLVFCEAQLHRLKAREVWNQRWMDILSDMQAVGQAARMNGIEREWLGNVHSGS